MAHNVHTGSTVNLSIPEDLSREGARDYYLGLLEGYSSPYPDPVVRNHDGIRVVRDDLIVGTKARAADPVLAKSNADRFVYCQPRTGLAGVSLLDAAAKRGRKVTLFMPACKQISHHQACCIERGADPVFERIAAMPNLNKYAREWAQETPGCEFVPLGLKHPLATAGIIKAAVTIPEPEIVFVAMSTGVLCRALQIAWPKAKFIGVAVARNIQDGEKGEAEVISEALPFQTPEKKHLPPFPSVDTYDAKVWKFIPKDSGRDILFWNVGTDPVLNDSSIIERTESAREWRKKPNLLEF